MAIHENSLPNRLSGTKFEPATAAQWAALNTPAEMLLFGGAAGSLKSQTMLVDASLLYRCKNYSAIIFRKSLDELRFLINRGIELYVNGLGAKYNEQQKTFKWPWGSQIKFTYLENDNDVFRLQGNEYQFVGFDESTHFMEFQVRYMINSRMRSVDGIPLKVRLASNPGNVGHDWHMKIFMGTDNGRALPCTHCQIADNPNVRIPFNIYQGSKWPSDGKEIGFTTQFIPGRVTDHNFFGVGGVDYKKLLAGLPDALAEALMNGCWAAFEGQYFDMWDARKMIVPYGMVDPQPWWPYWVGTDYGFGHLASSYLLTKSPSGLIYVLDGHEGSRIQASKYATQLKEKWGSFNPEPWFLSHEVFAQKGADHTIAEQMTMVSDIGFTPAGRDPEGRAMMIYSLLSDGILKLTDTPVVGALGDAIQTRIHDPKNRDAVKKVDQPADDRYDALGHALQAYIDDAKDQTAEDFRKKAEEQGHGDPTETMLKYQILKGREQSSPDVIYYRGGRLRNTGRR